MIYIKSTKKALNYAYDDVITEEINGRYDLEFKYPLNKIKVDELTPFTVLLADTLKDGLQEFYITYIKTTTSTIIVQAKHVFFMLDKMVIKSLNISKKKGLDAIQLFNSAIVDNNQFVFSSDIQSKHSFNIERVSALKALIDGKHSITGQWGGVLKRDNYKISLNKRRGIDTEYLLAKRKNIKEFEHVASVDEVITRLFLFAKVKMQSESGEDTEIIIQTTVDSPIINEYNNIYAKVIYYENDDIRDIESLTKEGKRIFQNNSIDIPKSSFTITTSEDVKRLNLGIDDTVLIYYEDYKLHRRLRVQGLEFSPIAKKVIKISFEKKPLTLSSILDIQKEEVKAYIKEDTRKRIDRLNNNFKAVIANSINNFEKLLPQSHWL